MTDAPATEWVSFVDADETTWMFDVSFLTSDWRCVFGQGCPGTEPWDDGSRGCCAHGAHLVDDDERQWLLDLSARLDPSVWENHDVLETEDLVVESDEGELVTARIDDACVFLNGPDFAGGPGCALHLAALAHDQPPHTWKPAVCWQVPFRLEYHENASGTEIVVVRSWRRSDWGEGGQDFSWWCTEHVSAAPTADDQTWRHHREELLALVGQWPMEQFARWVERETQVELTPTRR